MKNPVIKTMNDCVWLEVTFPTRRSWDNVLSGVHRCPGPPLDLMGGSRSAHGDDERLLRGREF